ncbi:MAG TPA: hypothetical protein VJA47_02875 [archaeon]|uniref:Phage-Barnase-EndoU-ColicinE5/D-RelE like nuclease 3 domain-containing protein n=1 Tax=Candidatus Blackburnbacteria bacterium RIFCSPHIGHO2_01_FULL_43_15b TaxID=1797513 RepID=A0A1G1V051_9BACT|nr:MAG: hypothetical protein A2782_03275 [Candidatus Blackburnbacteria bacterium RIFCSPHIGHO2_01_FULL_43_15b]HLD57219.1 hypothetical protein [archaeon]
MKKISLIKLHKLYIQGTEERGLVIPHTMLLCNTTNLVVKAINLASPKIHITTRMLKHLYDSKPAEEYEFILHSLVSIARYPDQVYENKGGKRGHFAFVKTIKGASYFCSLEITQIINEEEITEDMNFVVTAFRMRRQGYLKDYKLLWDRKDGSPSS